MPRLILRPISENQGELVAPLVLDEAGPIVAGRSSGADWTIADQAVSRRHAMFTRQGDRWFVHDIESRHGTSINGRRLAVEEQLPLEPGDLLQFGVWSCRVSDRDESTVRGTTIVGDDAPRTLVAPIPERTRTGLGQRGLDALLSASTELNEADSDDGVAAAVVTAIVSATACPRAMVVRAVGAGEYETLAGSDGTRELGLSRSLLAGAAVERTVVELRGDAASAGAANQAHSILDLGIRTAICAPILLGDAPEAFLYLDSRDAERALPEDAAAFCHAVARLAGLAMERLRAAELTARHARLTDDLGAAREAQRLLLPPSTGEFGPIAYAYEYRAGRIVAGDLFDILPLDDGRVGFILGDVSGKGVGAGVLMAAAQAQLRSSLRSGEALASAVASVNADIAARSASGTFVTLLAAVIDPVAEKVDIVDAGHGFGVHVGPGSAPKFVRETEGFPLGIVPDATYDTVTLGFPAGSRLVAFSDGVVEQPDPSGVQFGDDAAIDVIARADDPARAAADLLDAVAAHAKAELADDFTVAVAWCR